MSQNPNNLQTTSNYQVGISFLGDDILYAQNISIPGFNFNPIEQGGRSGTRVLFMSDTFAFDSITLDLFVDEKLELYKKLLKYVKDRINLDKDTFANKEFDCWVEIFNPMGISLLKIEYFGCFLDSIGALDLSSSEDTETTISLSIRITSYEVQDNSGIPDLVI